MNTKLITALRMSANALEQGTIYYDWHKPYCCNCGVLFCALTGKSPVDLGAIRPRPIAGDSSTWQVLIGQYCPISGIPTHSLFKELFSYGLTQKDMVDLEFMRNPKVLARMKPRTETVRRWRNLWAPVEVPVIRYDSKVDLISYMRAWADILTEDGRQDQVREHCDATSVQSA